MKTFHSEKFGTECVGITRVFFPLLKASEANLVSQSILTEPNVDTGYNTTYPPLRHTANEHEEGEPIALNSDPCWPLVIHR